MRIIKQGRPKATKNILRFRCCRCGCEFDADDTEYEQASQIAYVHDGIIATCICPCCGLQCTFLKKTEEESNERNT